MDKQIPTNSLISSRLKNRDKSALEFLYDEYAGALLGLIVTITKDDVIAHQILHDTFIKIWESSESYNCANCSIFTWMVGIARGQANDSKMRNSIEYHAIIPETSQSLSSDTIFFNSQIA